MKHCPRCEVSKPPTDFYANKRNKDGLQSWCRSCTSAASSEWRERDPAAFRRSALASEEKRKANRWAERATVLGPPVRCAICGKRFEPRTVHWDHDHNTGQPRGWLCSECNVALGKFGDNPTLLERAAAYLRERVFTVTKPVLS